MDEYNQTWSKLDSIDSTKQVFYSTKITAYLEKLNPINEGDIEWYSNPFFISYKRANLQESK